MFVDRKLERRARDARRKKLGSGRYGALVDDIVEAIQLALEVGVITTHWGLEGPLRAGMRADLCRQGWPWSTADMVTLDLLAEAFNRAGAKARPDWYEGQPEWAITAGNLIERDCCARSACNKPLLDGRPKFCSDLCRAAHHSHVARQKRTAEAMLVHAAAARI